MLVNSFCSPILSGPGNQDDHEDIPFMHEDEDLVEDQLIAMLHLERGYQVAKVSCTAHDQSQHTEWRRKICEWSYRVVDHFRLERDCVSIAMNYFDRYLSVSGSSQAYDGGCPCPTCQRSINSRTFQLAAMTSLYMAIKLHAKSSSTNSRTRKRLKLSSFVDLSRGQFRPADITAMETEILTKLQWKVNPTTATTLVSFFLRLLPPYSMVPYRFRATYDLVLHVTHELARYLAELSVCMPFSHALPSDIAYSSIVVAMELLTTEALPISIRNEFFQTSRQLTGIVPNSPVILRLCEQLGNAFYPEVLMEEAEDHPISVARRAGLLNIQSAVESEQSFHTHGDKPAVTTPHRHSARSVMEVPQCVTP